MTDGQQEFPTLGINPDDMPFGPEAERRRERLIAEEQGRRSVIAEIREKIRQYERRRLDRQEEEQRPGWVEETRRLIKEQDAGQRKQ